MLHRGLFHCHYRTCTSFQFLLRFVSVPWWWLRFFFLNLFVYLFTVLLTDVHQFYLALVIIPKSNLRQSSRPKDSVYNLVTVLRVILVIGLIRCPVGILCTCAICPYKLALLFLIWKTNPRLYVWFSNWDLHECVQQEVVFLFGFNFYQVSFGFFARPLSFLPGFTLVEQFEAFAVKLFPSVVAAWNE